MTDSGALDRDLQYRQFDRNVVSFLMALRLLTYVEQVADHLRSEIHRGHWIDELPGASRIGAELGVNHTTVIDAIRLLEKEGLLVFQGAGRSRKIVLPEDISTPSLRIAILLYERLDLNVDYIVDLQHRLLDAGHAVTFSSKALIDLNMDLSQVKRLVNQTKADAWVIQAGSRDLLNWFSQQPTPAMALAGRRRGIPIAGVGPDKVPALKVAVQRLVELGHRRIVMLAREERRKPNPGLIERTFLEELEQWGIKVGTFNLPDWVESPAGLHQCLQSLFRHTPPTAMIIDEAALFIGVEHQLAKFGLLTPRNVSLICLDPSPDFAWFPHGVSHITWDSRPMVQRIVRWAHHVGIGKEDRRQSFTKAVLIEGGTIGPVLSGG